MNNADIKGVIISVVLLLLAAIVGMMVTYYWHRRKEQKKLVKRVVELEKQVASLSQTVVPISTAFQQVLIKQLTHEHSPVLDSLLEKIGPPNILTDEQEVELLIELKKRAHDLTVDNSERDAAAMLPPVMRRVKMETTNNNEEGNRSGPIHD